MLPTQHRCSLARRALRPLASVGFVAFVCLLAPAPTVRMQSASPTGDVRAPRLDPGSVIEREMEGGGEHLYLINASAEQFLQILVQQKGMDVVLTLSGPDGQPISSVDRPNGTYGKETLSAHVKDSGTYKLHINSLRKVAAKGSYTLSITALRSSLPGDDARVLAEQAVSEGERLRALGTAESFRGAIERFERAAALWREMREPYEEAWALYGAGWSYASLGDNQEAARCFSRAVPTMGMLGDTYGEATTRTGLAWAEMYLGETADALEDFSKASQLHAEVGDVRGIGVTLHGLGWVQLLSGDLDRARGSFERALGFRRAARDLRGEALTLVALGKVRSRLGSSVEAFENLNAALRIIRDLGDKYAEADTLSHIGWIYISGGRWSEALSNFEQALPLRRLTGDSPGEATTMFGIATAKRALGDFQGALTGAEGSLRIIEKLRSKGANLQLRASYFASVRDYYQFTIDLLAELDQREPSGGYAGAALIVSERARVRALLDLLNEARISLTQGVAPELLRRKAEAQHQLAAADERRRLVLGGGHNGVQAKAVTEEVAASARQYEDVEAQVREASPQYAAITQPILPTVADIQDVIGDDGLLLEYFIGKERSYLWTVGRGGVNLHMLPGRETLETAARAAYGLVTSRNRGLASESAAEKSRRVAAADSAYRQSAARLSTLLLAPAAPALGRRRLLIVADGALQYIPFSALPEPNPAGHVDAQGTPLILGHEVVSLPSAATLVALRKMATGRPLAPKSVVVFADPVFDAADERLGHGRVSPTTYVPTGSHKAITEQPGHAKQAKVFPRLFLTRWEAEQIVSLAAPPSGMMATDWLASRVTATSPSMGAYRIVHFATHAIIDASHPALSGVVLSLVDERGRPQDGILYAHDIFNLRLNADLVVLSACRTALGKEDRAEGLISLTRGFMYAGAPRVVASLWAVNDKATAGLMVSFYRKILAEHLSPAAALRAAQIEAWRDGRWRSPYYWGAFTLQGEWR